MIQACLGVDICKYKVTVACYLNKKVQQINENSC